VIKLQDIYEGTCGYGEDGELGDEPAGPHLLKKKNESVGSKKYNGRDWFWPHDYRHYLRDASPAQRKKIHDAWLKIGIPVKGTGLKISDRYLEPKKNQLKKAWTIVRKVVAPKELGMPIPESVNEAKYKGYDYKRQNRKDGLPLIVPALQKTFSNMKDLKKYIDKHGTMESVNEAFRPSDRKVLMVIGRDIIRNLNKTYHKGTLTPSKQLGQALNSIFRAMTRDKGDANYQQYKKYFPKYNDKLLKRLSKAYFNEPVNVQNTFIKKVMDYSLKESVFDLDEACQKGYMTHPTRKTKIMFGKRYRNCVKKEGVDTTMTMEQAGRIMDNLCVNCGDFANENLKKWFSDRWVNIGKKKKGGGHPPCGSSGKKRGYAKCVPASKAANMSKKQKASATRRKRAAQNKAGRGGTSSLSGGGKKPIRVSTKPKK
jgi:hypothetical protein